METTPTRSRCTLKVQGLDCPTEAAILRRALEGSPGVLGLDFDLVEGRMTVEYDPNLLGPPALVRKIADGTGFRAEPIGTSDTAAPPTVLQSRWSFRRREWTTATSGLALGLGVLIGYLGSASAPIVLFAVAIGAAGVDLLPRALQSLRLRRLDIHVLIILAIVGAVALGQWDEAATLAFLFGVSELLEARSLERARRSMRALLAEAPTTADVISTCGSAHEMEAARVPKGATVRVRPGARVPLDGTITVGISDVDQKAITGEGLPVTKRPGDPVYAGTVNGDAALEFEVTGTHDETLLAKIVERVRSAGAGRAPTEQAVERFAAIYTPIVVGLAALVMLVPPIALSLTAGSLAAGSVWADWLFRGLVVLVIACPCALVIATPVAVVSALTSAARRGVLVKAGPDLEAFGRLRLLAFDKTGTLTRGTPDVVEVVAADGAASDDDEVLRIAAAVGDRGAHLVGRAIARHARDRELTVPSAEAYRAEPGRGAVATVDSTRYHLGSHRWLDESGLCQPDSPFHTALGDAERTVGTSVALAAETGPLGWIRLADRSRPEAASALAELKALGLDAVLLTGDASEPAEALAAELGITEVHAALLPDDKARIVAALDADPVRGPAGMIGDGINDAPALAAARVSVALGGAATAAAIDAADIVVLADDLGRLPWLVRHSRATRARIIQNIALALGVKALVLIAAVFGYADLWMAIAADLGTTLLVVANALRLLRA